MTISFKEKKKKEVDRENYVLVLCVYTGALMSFLESLLEIPMDKIKK